MREIKFRAWDKVGERMAEVKSFSTETYDTQEYVTIRDRSGESVDSLFGEYEVMQYTGLHDKNGKDIYEGDIVRIRHGIGDTPGWYSEAYYQTSIEPLYGIELHYLNNSTKDRLNQIPIHTTLNSRYQTLREDYVNSLYDHLAVQETWGENHMSGNKWKNNHYSNDIELIGNIYENPELLIP